MTSVFTRVINYIFEPRGFSETRKIENFQPELQSHEPIYYDFISAPLESGSPIELDWGDSSGSYAYYHPVLVQHETRSPNYHVCKYCGQLNKLENLHCQYCGGRLV